MIAEEIDKINKKYAEYCKNDGRKSAHLPFVIWLKYRAKIDPNEYYKEDTYYERRKTKENKECN